MNSQPTHLQLAHLPTPLHPLPRLSKKTGVDFWIKRDDLTGDVGLTGNKVRKLEHLVADAVRNGSTHLITIGGPQSNHARSTAAVAARLGLKCVLLLIGKDPGDRRGNLLLDELFGAEIRFGKAPTPTDQREWLAKAATEISQKGGKPYVIPLGGSSPLGVLGSIECYREMASSLRQHSWLCVATGSTGTQAGLLLGAWQSRQSVRVQGFSVLNPSSVATAELSSLVIETGNLFGNSISPGDLSIQVEDRFSGPSYGVASREGEAAMKLLAGLEGILLDPVYTAKAMAGVLSYIEEGTIKPGSHVVFIHTGGAPSLFNW